MIESVNQQVKKWLLANLKNVSLSNPVSIHIDELLSRELSQAELIEASLQAFVALYEQMKEMQTPVKPGLVIPLVTISKRIERAVPSSWAALTNQLDIEPPSLYLLDWAPGEYFVTCEEYRIPLPFDLIGASRQGVYSYYKEVRYADAIQNDWEFTRAVYVEYHPGL